MAPNGEFIQYLIHENLKILSKLESLLQPAGDR